MWVSAHSRAYAACWAQLPGHPLISSQHPPPPHPVAPYTPNPPQSDPLETADSHSQAQGPPTQSRVPCTPQWLWQKQGSHDTGWLGLPCVSCSAASAACLQSEAVLKPVGGCALCCPKVVELLPQGS